ncbi:MAG: hypothetical protein ACI81L_003446 [Verrucomicrobiales bacterium]|jgi:hypothetical protein
MISDICAIWETAALVEPVSENVACRSTIVLGTPGDQPRFCFVSVGSPIETLLHDDTQLLDRTWAHIGLGEIAKRLIDGEVAAVLAPPGPQHVARSAPELPQEFLERRQVIRQDNVLARFLLRQIGLEEVSSHRGAPARLYDDLRALWSLDLSLCIDPAMLLTLGADRQRYVDEHYNERATDRLPRALGRLHDLGVRSYPRLVIV